MQTLIQKMALLTLSKKILLTSILLYYPAYAEDIGGVTEHTGSGGINRDGDLITTAVGVGVMQEDAVSTVNGRMLLTFLDDSVVRLTEHTDIVLTKYYYDPLDKAKSSMTMSFVAGTARFATGRLGLVPKENIAIVTPTATIGVRGTDFTTTVDELGRTLVILLPETECTIDGDCSPSGEITVTNEGGVVVLSEAYQATMVSNLGTSPTVPTRLDNITLNMIDNMFIVSPPKEVDEAVEEQASQSDNQSSILDFTELDTDYLADDFLAEDDLEYNELDRDLLDVDFLQDVLVAIEEIDILKRSTSSAQGNSFFTGTKIGFDKTSQYSSIIDTGTGQIWFYRDVNGVISARIPISSNTTLDTTNEGKRNVITVGDGQSVVIIINQSGG